MIKTAQVIGKLAAAGVENVVNNYCRFSDPAAVSFDLFVDTTSEHSPPEDMVQRGIAYHYVPSSAHPLARVIALVRLFRSGGYQVVHAHLNTLNVLTLFAAWLAGVPVRVSHNHSTADRGEGFRAFIKLLLRPTATWFATAYMACGEKAARWLFGNRRVDAGRVTILPNAIDVCKFRYDPLQREQIRQELGLQGKQVIGHIGRFMPQKNHGFLLKCFAQCHASHPQTHLLLAGGGEGIRSAREQAERLGVSDAVCFAGVRNDPWRLYSVMDVFMLPSLYEGVPVVCVEAQANGLPCLVSDHVSMEAAVGGDVTFLPLDPSAWIQALDAVLAHADGEKRANAYASVTQSGFDIRDTARRLLKYYTAMLESVRNKPCRRIRP